MKFISMFSSTFFSCSLLECNKIREKLNELTFRDFHYSLSAGKSSKITYVISYTKKRRMWTKHHEMNVNGRRKLNWKWKCSNFSSGITDSYDNSEKLKNTFTNCDWYECQFCARKNFWIPPISRLTICLHRLSLKAAFKREKVVDEKEEFLYMLPLLREAERHKK